MEFDILLNLAQFKEKFPNQEIVPISAKCGTAKDNTVNRLNIRVRLCSHHLSFHLKKQIPMKSTQVTVYEWALELVYTINI